MHFLPNFSASISPCTSASLSLYSCVLSAPSYTLAFPVTHPLLQRTGTPSWLSSVLFLSLPWHHYPHSLFLHWALPNAFSPNHSVFSALSFVARTPATKAPSPFLLPSISLELSSFLYISLFSFFLSRGAFQTFSFTFSLQVPPTPPFCRLFVLPSLIFCLLTCPFLFHSPSLPRDRPHTLVLPLSWPPLRSHCFHKAVGEVICTCGTPWSSLLNPTDRNVCSSWASGLILNEGGGGHLQNPSLARNPGLARLAWAEAEGWDAKGLESPPKTLNGGAWGKGLPVKF